MGLADYELRQVARNYEEVDVIKKIYLVTLKKLYNNPKEGNETN